MLKVWGFLNIAFEYASWVLGIPVQWTLEMGWPVSSVLTSITMHKQGFY